MNILLVQPKSNWEVNFVGAPSTALMILGTLAKQKGHKVKILHLDVDRVDFKEELKKFKPDIVGITAGTFHVRSARKIASEARRAKSKVIIGGAHSAAWTDDIEADEIVVGEGENRWLEILGEKPITLDEVPYPDYSLVDLDKFCGISPQVGAVPSFCMMASRGCPFNCIFCNTPAYWGKKMRYRDPLNVVGEVEYLHKMYGAREVFFQDDTFNLNHEWAFGVFEEIIKRGLNKEMIFRICARVNEKLLTEEFLDMAIRAGVWNIFYGLESGSQEMLDNMKKGITVEEINRAIDMTRKKNLQTACALVVGLPGESWETLRKTGLLIQRKNMSPFLDNNLIRYGWGFACPFPNTELERIVREKGHVLKIGYEDYHFGSLMCRTDKMDFGEMARFRGFQKGG